MKKIFFVAVAILVFFSIGLIISFIYIHKNDVNSLNADNSVNPARNFDNLFKIPSRQPDHTRKSICTCPKYTYEKGNCECIPSSLRICLATTEFAGIDEHGGIGTAFYRLAVLLAKNNVKVTVAYISYPNCVGKECNWKFWKQNYRSQGIQFVPIRKTPSPSHSNGYMKQSLKLYQWLHNRQNDFDTVHFHDYLGIGYHTLMAKKLGISFQNIPLVNQGHGTWYFVNSHLNATLDANQQIIRQMEESSIRMADMITFPSDFYSKWTFQNVKELRSRGTILPNLMDEDNIVNTKWTPSAIDQVIFFGRFSKIKGIDIFVKAMEMYNLLNYKVTFLGNAEDGLVDGIQMDKYFAKLKFKHSVITGKSTQWCMQYLSQSGVLAIIPSRVETFSLVVLELLFNRVRFIASRAGAIPELVPDSLLFDPNPKDLFNKLKNVRSYEIASPKWTIQEMNDKWIRNTREVYENYKPDRPPNEFPLISVVLKNGNGFPEKSLRYLSEQIWKYFHVVLTNDQTPDQILKKCKGKFLLFMNDLDEITPNLLETYAKVAASTQPRIISHLMDPPHFGIIMTRKKYISRLLKENPRGKIVETTMEYVIPSKLSSRGTKNIENTFYSLFSNK
jgi:glycosyltransferase involved in cell wall biosynthesis